MVQISTQKTSTTNLKMEENKHNSQGQNSPEGTATHSGWSHFYVLFSKYRDECIKVSQIVFGTGQETSLKYISNYHSALYSMAQQIFPFYGKDLEKELTDEWFALGSETEDAISLAGDEDFKNQMIADGQSFISKDLKTKLLMFFNRINRLAAEAGLLVGTEAKGSNEPTKGMMGLSQ
jgi:hypothetical protein